MGASLAEMVSALTLFKEKYAASHDAMRPILEAAQLARSEFMDLAREDSEAYDDVVGARRMPKETDEQKTARSHRIAVANRRAAEVPMETARAAVRLMGALPELADLRFDHSLAVPRIVPEPSQQLLSGDQLSGPSE